MTWSATIATEDGQKIFATEFLPESGAAVAKKTGANLLILHGFGEHLGRYQHLATALASSFDRFFAYDQRGHGRSTGVRGDGASLSAFVQDLKVMLEAVRALDPSSKIYVLGHSFGGLVALNLALEEKRGLGELQPAGYILSAPFLGIALRVPPYKLAAAKILRRTLPKLQLGNEINPSQLTHDPAIVEAYVLDRLVHTKITPRLYFAMVENQAKVVSSFGPLNAPSLFLLPGQDAIADSKATLGFFNNLKDREKRLCEYPDFYHEVLNELERARAFREIEKWRSK